MPHLPRIVILGRPNVGKSTLFNRLCKQRRALVGNEPGMTRDRLYARAEWLGKPFEVIDTGGIIPSDKELIPIEIYRQAQKAIEEAAHLILVVDGREGVVPLDEELAQLLRRTGKPLAVAVNKVDAEQHAPLAGEFHRLGIKHIFPISAEHGLGLDDLLDHVTAGFPQERHNVEMNPTAVGEHGFHACPGNAGTEEEGSSLITRHSSLPRPVHPITRSPDHPISGSLDNPIHVAIIGRPNVGKSTLLNQLLKEERSIVSAVPGTTRDAVDAEVELDGLHFRFVDTAGIRRKGKTKLLAEKLSVIQARKHLERADVALLILDAEEGVNALDTHIGGYAHESRRSVIIVVNKWDAIKKGPTTTQEFTAGNSGSYEVPGLRAHCFYLRPARAAVGKFVKDHRASCRSPPASCQHGGDEPISGGGGFRARFIPVGQAHPALLFDPSGSGAAHLHCLHQSLRQTAFFLRALSRKPHPRKIRFRWAHPL